MFNADFYPSPRHIIERMLAGHSIKGKVVLEPSAGRGDIIDYLNEQGAKEVLCCEINQDLAIIAASKGRFIANDFLTVTREQVAHIHMIVMNPPFSADEKHVLHAWEIAPSGCVIVSLCNYNTFTVLSSRERMRFRKTIEDNGTIVCLGGVFGDADRKTDADIGLVTLHKPQKGDTEFDGYLFSDEEEAEINGGNGLMSYNRIRDIVGRYIQGVQMFDSVIAKAAEINAVIEPLGGNFKVKFDAIEHRGNDCLPITRDGYKKELQKSAWRAVFNELKTEKYLTASAKEKVNKFVEEQLSKPFTMHNIFAMVDIIKGTHESRMYDVVEEVFDWLTERHHDNRSAVPGWKTNSMYFVGKKFIAPYVGLSMGYQGQPSVGYGGASERMEDLIKALCVVSGKNYNDMQSLRSFFEAKEVPNEDEINFYTKASEATLVDLAMCKYAHSYFRSIGSVTDKAKFINRICFDSHWFERRRNELELLFDYYAHNIPSPLCYGKRYDTKQWGTWYDWTFFRIKAYKKGTLHCEFLDEKVWERFNQIAVKKKGWALPTNTGSDVRRKGTGVEVFR